MDFGTTLAAIVTIVAYSYLFGDNPLYRFLEHLFIGITAAVMTIQAVLNIKNQAVTPILAEGQYLWVIGIIGGIMMLARFTKKYAWVSRAPLSLIIGATSALSIIRAVESEIVKQVAATVNLKWTSVDGAIYILCVVLPMAYLIFTINEKSKSGHAVTSLGKLGQYAMMLAFGASMGATVMARISMVVGRLQFLIQDWLKLGV